MADNIFRSDGITLAPRTASGPPTSGFWYEGTIVTDVDSINWKCTTSGTPGVWEKMADDTVRAYVSDGLTNTPVVTILGNDITIGTCEAVFWDNPDRIGSPNLFTFDGDTFSIPPLTTQYIYADYNGGDPYLIMNASSAAINESNVIPIVSVAHDGNDLHYRLFNSWANGAIAMHNQNQVRTRGFVRQNGFALGEKPGRFVTIDTGTAWYGIKMYANIPALAADTDLAYVFYHMGGNWTEVHGQIPYDNLHWDDGTNQQSLTAGHYGVNWVFRLVEDGPGNDEIYMVLGRGNYATIADALASTIPSPPSNISGLSMLIGRVVVERGAGSASVIQNAWDATLSFSSSVQHNDTLGIQGGAPADYYHLTQTEHDTLVDGFDADSLHTHDQKADKVVGGVTGNLAALDAGGNLTDSGKAPGDIASVGSTAPANVTKATASAGVSAEASRVDHKHNISTAAPSTIGTSNTEGTATTLARSDHVHDHGSQAGGSLHAEVTGLADGFMSASDKTKLDNILTSTAPVNVTKAAAVVGIATDAAKADHKHDITAGTPVATGTANTEGVATSMARSDHIHNTVLTFRHELSVGMVGSNVDHTSIAAAVAAAVAGGASAADPWVITIHPGTYTVAAGDQPIVVPKGVYLTNHPSRRIDSVFIVAGSPTTDLFQFSGGSMCGVNLSGVTDPAHALVRCSTPGTLSGFFSIRIDKCSYGLYVENGAAAIVIEGSSIIDGPSRAITGSAFYATGAGTTLGFFTGLFVVPAAVLPAYSVNPMQTCITYDNGATGELRAVSIQIAPKDNTQVGLLVDNGAFVKLLSSSFNNNHVAIRIGAGGSDSTVVTQGATFTNNTWNYESLSATGKILESAEVDSTKRNLAAGTTFSGIVQDRFNNAISLVGYIQYLFDSGRGLELQDNIHMSSGTGVLTGGKVTDAGGLFVNVAGGIGVITRGAGTVVKGSPYDVGQFTWLPAPGLALTDNAINYVSYNSNTDAIEVNLAVFGTSSVPLAIVITKSGAIRYLHEARNFEDVFPQQVQDYIAATQKTILKSGLGVTAGSTARKITVASGTYYLVLTEVPYAGAVDATFSSFYSAGSVETPGLTDIDILNYDDAGSIGAGLQPMTGGWYRSDSVYLTSDGRISVVYGTTEHLTSAEAEALPIEPPPSFISYSSFPLAQLIVKQGFGITLIIDRRSSISTGGGAGVSVHSALAGLDADDHHQYMLVTGGRAMSGDLDMGGNDITNVGTVAGVDVTDHHARHAPGASDALATGTPSAVQVGAAAAEGSAATFTRADHQHGITAGSPVTVGTANADGAASSVARSDHVHAHGDQSVGSLHAVAIAGGANGFLSGSDKTKLDGVSSGAAALTAAAPADVTKSAAVVGVATTAAKADHKHDVSTATPGSVTLGATAAEGAATSLARSDHTHGTGTPLAPADVTKAAASAGASSTPAREDHKHDVSTGTPGSTSIAAIAAEGSATSLARSDHTHGMGTPAAPANVTKAAAATGSSSTPAREDHKHDVTTSAPSTIGTANTEGAASSLARSDHVHSHGAQTDGTLHAEATEFVAGFMSAADKAKLDGSLSDTPAVDADTGTASAGVAIVGSRQDHKHHVPTALPGNIGTANSEGAATTLARSSHVHAHGAQSDGSLHSVAIAGGANGFLSGTDKTKLDGVSSGAAALTSSAPSDVTKAAAVVGVGTTAARSDHKHDISTAAPGSTGVATASGEGSATSLARSDHTHQSNTAPANVTKATAAIGSSGEPARADHKHDISTGAPSAIGTANAEGSATSLARSDHVHDHGSQTSGTLHAVATTSVAGFESAADKTKLDGIASGAAALTSSAPANVTKAAAVVGSATDAAKADHKHDITTAAPSSIGTANAEGSAISLARSDHVHDHGAQTSGTLHAVATTSVAGFESAADKTKLDGLTPINTLILASDFTVTNAGLTNVPGMSFAVTAGKAYRVEVFGVTSADNTTGDIALDVVADAATFTTTAGWAWGMHYANNGSLTNRNVAALNSTTAVFGALVVNNGDGVVRAAQFTIEFTCSASTTVRLQIGNASAGAGRNSTIYAGAQMRVTQIRT